MIDFHGAVVSFYVQIMLSRKRRTDLNLNSIFIRGIVWISKLVAGNIPETTGFPFFFFGLVIVVLMKSLNPTLSLSLQAFHRNKCQICSEETHIKLLLTEYFSQKKKRMDLNLENLVVIL